MGWWLWPRPDRLVKPGSVLVQLGELGDDGRGLVAAPHAHAALASRVFGVPALAPFFHCAFGWGIAAALQIFGHTPRGALLAVLAGPALAMAWDPPIRLIHYAFGAAQTVSTRRDAPLARARRDIRSPPAQESAACLILLTFALPLLLGPPLRSVPSADWLLFVAPLVNAIYFVYNATLGRGAALLPPPLKLGVITVAVAASAAYARATGVLCRANNSPTTATALRRQKIKKR